MINSTRIRKATAADLPVIQDIARRTIDHCYRPFVGNEGVDWHLNSGESDRELERTVGNCEVVTRNGDIVAFTVYFGDLIHLLMVDVPFHNMGIGSKLLAHSEKRLFDGGYVTIRVETFAGNDRAISFYVKHGWAIARREEDERHGFVRVVFEKQVPAPPAYSRIHITPFLRYCFKGSWAGNSQPQRETEDVQSVMEASLSGAEFLQSCDGDSANEEGNAAADQHCGEDGSYPYDCGEAFFDFPTKTPEEACDFEELAAMLVSRYQSGILTKSQLNRMKPWWQLWRRVT